MITVGKAELVFANIIWDNEPISSAKLSDMAFDALGWKKTTAYTVLHRLCEKGIFKNVKATVTSVLNRDAFNTLRSQQFVEENFEGSLPAFVAAFTANRSLTPEEAEALRKLIENM